MTLLVMSIAPNTLDQLHVRSEQAWAGGAEAVEVRIDTFTDDPAALAAYLKARENRTWIVTCRSAAEGGHFRGCTMDRVSLLVAAARGTNAYVDFELADWRGSEDVREKVRLASATPEGSAHRLILSAHNFGDVPADLSELVDEMVGVREASAAKVAYKASHICDTFEALDLLHRRGGAVAAVAMGEDGLWTRVLAKKLGAFATCCALEAAATTAPGQLTLDEMVNRYRWPAIDASTRVFGVIGDPVAHSMSPLLFNRWFADAGINAVYLPLHVGQTSESVEEGNSVRRFLDDCRARPWLDIGGFSVTIPHKMAALGWVGDGADAMAKSIGALNTLSFHGETVTGCNTDCYAAVSSLTDALGCSRKDLAGLPVDVLGTGGAARAVLYGLQECGCAVTVYGRSPEKTRRLADEFGARAAAWEQRNRRSAEVLIHCTGVGMWPETDATPMPADSLGPPPADRLVFDLIYNPLETRLLKDATGAGATALCGLDMFVRQAAMQFELWTGVSPDTQQARDLITREISRRTGKHP